METREVVRGAHATVGVVRGCGEAGLELVEANQGLEGPEGQGRVWRGRLELPGHRAKSRCLGEDMVILKEKVVWESKF